MFVTSSFCENSRINNACHIGQTVLVYSTTTMSSTKKAAWVVVMLMLATHQGATAQGNFGIKRRHRYTVVHKAANETSAWLCSILV